MGPVILERKPLPRWLDRPAGSSLRNQAVIFSLFLAVLVVSGMSPLLAFDDIEMLPTRLKLDSSKSRDSNSTTRSTEIAYSVAVSSRAFKELQNVTVKYNIYYADSQLGSSAEPAIRTSSGSHVFPSLLTNKEQTFSTKPIKLESASLDGGWYFTSGASNLSKDKVVGIWLKAFDSAGKQIGEYVNPSSVPKKRTWKD